MDTLVVTAYYPVKTGKHSKNDYNKWIQIFFECVTCPVIFFCDSKIKEELPTPPPNIKFIEREFRSFKLMQEPWKSKWEEFYKIDHEKHIHSPDLYAIWGAKQEFVSEAIKLQEAKCYIWCDVGCFRFKRPGSFRRGLNLISPGKITCLDVSKLIGVKQPLIGGGVLAGDSTAWSIFSKNYLEELEKNIEGKDQIVYRKILNDSNAVIIQPNYDHGDPWFYLSYALCFLI
jgi:hypothetical protein